jgi:hypothetical protein
MNRDNAMDYIALLLRGPENHHIPDAYPAVSIGGCSETVTDLENGVHAGT